MKKTIVATVVAVVVAVALAAGNFVHTSRVDTRFEAFRNGICSLAASQGKTNHKFYGLLKTLESRAIARERIDQANHNYEAAQADADSARLYQAALSGSDPKRGEAVKNLCG